MYIKRWFLPGSEIIDALSLRRKVFLDEQKFSYDKDEIDSLAYHLVIYDENKEPVACARLFQHSKEIYKIGRVAVRKDLRLSGIGTMVMNEIESKALELGAKELLIAAQCRAKSFYDKIGFVSAGEKYLDDYCETINMKKYL
jgi:predicted GNAT family N-acyltransferase